MAIINLTKGNTSMQSTAYNVSLSNGDSTSPISISDIEHIGITLKTITSGELKVFVTDDENMSVWVQELDPDGVNPFFSSGIRKNIFHNTARFIKFESVGGDSNISISFKNS